MFCTCKIEFLIVLFCRTSGKFCSNIEMSLNRVHAAASIAVCKPEMTYYAEADLTDSGFG